MVQPGSAAARDILQAHAAMRLHGEVPKGRVPTVIEASWRRCMASGLRWDERQSFDPGPRDRLDLMRDRNTELILHALPVMETLHHQIANTQSMVVLADATGYLLHSLGDPEFLSRADRVALAPGVEWSEVSKGTNAIGTALAEQGPVVVHGAQHYLVANHFLTCSAAPIFDPYGRPAGALDVSGDRRSFSPHTLALVNMSVQMIENHLFSHTFADLALLRFHARPEFLGTLVEGLAAFSPDGRVISVNRSGCFQLGLDREALQGVQFEALFSLPFGTAMDNAGGQPLSLLLHSGVRVFGQMELREPCRTSRATPPASPAREPLFFVQDAELQKRVQQGERALDKGLALLIQGDTGTGKATLARHYHRDQFGHLAWIEIACGAVEADEFLPALNRAMARPRPGERHAFLFLRDVDGLSAALQARLVAALRTGQPFAQFGAQMPVIVASTRRRLRELVEAGRFRDDLYFHLSAAQLTLPPLRRRQDIWALATRLAEEGSGLGLDEALRARFESHPWRGNVRQLHNVLRAASAQVESRRRLEEKDFPEDFLSESSGRRVGAAEAGDAINLATITLQAIVAAVEAHGGNVSAAARSLGVSRSTLYRRLRDERIGSAT